MKKILILTAGFGEGHNAAARNLAAAFDSISGPGSSRTVDLLAESSPRLNEISRRCYLGMINRTPRLWSRFYSWIDRSRRVPGRLLIRRDTRLLAELIQRERPDVICSTFPLYCYMLEQLAHLGRLNVPYFSIVTDSISINSIWWRAGCDGWFVPNEDTAEVFRRAGIPDELLHVSGFPVPAFFSENAAVLSPPDLAAGRAPRVLYIINTGTRNAAATAKRLLAEEDWEITCAVGRDESLRRQLQALANGRRQPATILGWTNQIPRLLMTHHVVVSKAGGATTQEAIAARCPMIVNQIVPGQEEGNYELLRRHGIGALAETPDTTITSLQRAFADHGAVWNDWRRALEPLARPNASRAIADAVLARIADAAPAP